MARVPCPVQAIISSSAVVNGLPLAVVEKISCPVGVAVSDAASSGRSRSKSSTPGLFLLHPDHVLAVDTLDVLRFHAGNIRAPLRGVEQECSRAGWISTRSAWSRVSENQVDDGFQLDASVTCRSTPASRAMSPQEVSRIRPTLAKSAGATMCTKTPSFPLCFREIRVPFVPIFFVRALRICLSVEFKEV